MLSLTIFLIETWIQLPKRQRHMQQKKKLIGRLAHKGRVVTMREIRKRITKRDKYEVEKARNALRQVEIAAEKKEKAKINTQKRTKKTLFKEVRAYLKVRPQFVTSLI